MPGIDYRYRTSSLEGFVQQLAVSYIARGRYFFYVSGGVPPRIARHVHDRRMLEKYEVAKSRWSRCRRRKQRDRHGERFANTQYIRHDNFWVLLCQEGQHKFFEEHLRRNRWGAIVERQFFDVRRKAITYGGYSIRCYGERLSVRMTGEAYDKLKGYFLEQALAPLEALHWEFSNFPYAAWGPVQMQIYSILKAVNQRRTAAGMCAVPKSCVPRKRRPVKPFDIAENDFAIAA